jgi:phage shock protein E
MKKYLIIFLTIIFAVLIFFRFGAKENVWVCQAGSWVTQGKPAVGVPQELCDNKQTIYLDVRTDQEWEQEHIKGATHFSLDRLKAAEVPLISKDTNVLIYCRSGSRAQEALGILQTAGFSSVTNAGGLEGLKTQGYPTE